MWHFIFEAIPTEQPVTLAVLDSVGFHGRNSLGRLLRGSV
jgi:hypothetical protein